MPCPKRNLNSYLEEKCIQDFVDCPKLCRLPDQEWKNHEQAGQEICRNLNPYTTETVYNTTEFFTTVSSSPTSEKSVIKKIIKKLQRLIKWTRLQMYPN